MIAGAVVACEIAFWVLLGAGLTARYVLGRPSLGLILLCASPLADLLLLVQTAGDLHRGATATQAHALAAVYVGVSVAFGSQIVRAADRRFAHRFAGQSLAPKPVLTPRERVGYEWREFRRAVLAWAISSVLLLALAAVAGDVDRGRVLFGYLGVLSIALVIWLLVGPLPAVLRAGRERDRHAPRPASKPIAAARAADARRWAPWWVYLVLILGANYLRQALITGVPSWADVLIALALAAAVFAAITAVFRAIDQDPRTCR